MLEPRRGEVLARVTPLHFTVLCHERLKTTYVSQYGATCMVFLSVLMTEEAAQACTLLFAAQCDWLAHSG